MIYFPHDIYGDAIAAGTGLTTDLTLKRVQSISGWRRQRRQFAHNASTLTASWQLSTLQSKDLVLWLENNNDWFMLRMISGNDHWQTCSVFEHEVRRTSQINCTRVPALDQFTVAIELETRSMVRWEDLTEQAVGVRLQNYPSALPLPRYAGFQSASDDSLASTYTLSYTMNTATLRNWLAFASVLGTTWFLMRMVSPSMPDGELEVMRFVNNPTQTLIRPDTWEVTVQAETMPKMFSVGGVSQPADVMPPYVNPCGYNNNSTYDDSERTYDCGAAGEEPAPNQYDRFELACLPFSHPNRMLDHVNGDWVDDDTLALMGISPENALFPPYCLRINYGGYTPGSNAPRFYIVVPTFRPSNFSYRCWLRTTNLSSVPRSMVAARTLSTAGSRVLFSLSLVNDELWAQLGNIFLYSFAGIQIDTHHFVELSVDANETMRIFVDGNLIRSVNAAQADFVVNAEAVEMEIRPVQRTNEFIEGLMYLEDMAMDRNPSVVNYTPPSTANCGSDPVPPPTTPAVTMTGNAPDANSNVSYSYFYALGGGVPPISARFVSGNLPPGISILASGQLIGQAPSGTFTFVLEAIDSVGELSQPLTDTITFTPVPVTTPPPTRPPGIGDPESPTIEN